MPTPVRCGTQDPSDPVRGQLAPPRASTQASAVATLRVPSAFSKAMAPSPSHPSQVRRVRTSTPRSLSRRSHARSSAVARKPFGNTRPLLPTKVPSPSPSHHARKAAGSKRSRAGVSRGRAAP